MSLNRKLGGGGGNCSFPIPPCLEYAIDWNRHKENVGLNPAWIDRIDTFFTFFLNKRASRKHIKNSLCLAESNAEVTCRTLKFKDQPTEFKVAANV